MSSQQATFVCKECKEIVHYDFAQNLNEEEWKQFQDIGASSKATVPDREKILEQSFVMINDSWDKAQNYQLQHAHFNHRRTLNSTVSNRSRQNATQLAPSTEDSTLSASNGKASSNSSSSLANNQSNLDNHDIGTIDESKEFTDFNKESAAGVSVSLSITNASSNPLHPAVSAQPINGHSHKSSSNGINGDDFAQSLNVLQQILEIAAGHAKVEHPLCSDCTDKIVKDLDGQIEELKLEKKTLTSFISEWESEQKQIAANSNGDADHTESNSMEEETRLKEHEEEAKLLEKKLVDLAMEKERLKLEYEQLEMESQRMNEFEEMFFCDANDFWYSIENLSMQHAAVRQKIRQVSTHLDMMKRTNVFDDAFHIYHDGHFGTINGLRLGRLPSVSVEWEEINTGLGQCVLLLDVLAQRCKSKNFKFKTYELYPMGSFSYIKEKKKNAKNANIHHMYGSTGLFGYKQCDKALECFLQCIKQFADWMKLQDHKFNLRYQVHGHQIGDHKKTVSIRFAGSSEENWTQALKYMVIDLKYLLAWVARYSP
eukprot:CAMPEP_0197034632 /NCGR_PEP_ID=MMETSP1384-20130603/12683_1 /TAXON_ID=29189 /ORGANISM="Ammonia sp." /LENGTH=541 /DNA_ID=CAMNT_0042464581 /DNA_START=18 /DNA_END=1643 /DNA_ORIENTATION=-